MISVHMSGLYNPGYREHVKLLIKMIKKCEQNLDPA